MIDNVATKQCCVALFILLLAIAADCGAAQMDPAPHIEMAACIDQLLAQRWSELSIQLAQAADDSELVRRTYLDLTGLIRRVSQARGFVNDQHHDRKRRPINSTAHVTHSANT